MVVLPTVKFDCIACFACIVYLVINWMTGNSLINPQKATYAYNTKCGLMLVCSVVAFAGYVAVVAGFTIRFSIHFRFKCEKLSHRNIPSHIV